MQYNPCIAVLIFIKLFITNVKAETSFKYLADLCIECDCDLQRLLTESKTQEFLNNFRVVCGETFGKKFGDAGFSKEWENFSQKVDILNDKNITINNIELYMDNVADFDINKLMTILNPAIQFRKISFASNFLLHVPKEIFPNSVALEELNLSENFIHYNESVDFKGLKKLKRIYLNDNNIWNFDFDWLEDSYSLEEVDLRENRMKSMNCQNTTFRHLKSLDLSLNHLNSVTFKDLKICFSKFPQLRYLNVSNNKIVKVLDYIFESLQELRLLDLSFNGLYYFSFHTLKGLINLEQLFLQRNVLGKETGVFPDDVLGRNLTRNFIGNMETVDSNSLVSLNISFNRLQDVKYVSAFLPKLRELNVSWNSIRSVISCSTFKSLRRLILDGNPLDHSKLDLSDFVSLDFLSLNEIEKFEHFFPSKVAGIFTNKSSIKCSTLIMSHNPNLRGIVGNFSWTNICKFDLSFNKISYIKRNMFNWDKVKWINLQGNPLMCQCEQKWMVYDLVPFLLKADPSLLKDLRCAEPKLYREKRLVNLYNKSSTFCVPSENSDVSDSHDRITGDNSEFIVKYGIFLAFGFLAAIIIVMLALGYVYFKIEETKSRREQRERNVRYSPSREGVIQPT